MDLSAKGQAALDNGDFDGAVAAYSEAIAQAPKAATYYIQRSIAHLRRSPADRNAALKDAEAAVVLAHERQTRELIAKAQLRRAIALLSLDQYANAGYVLGLVKEIMPSDNMVPILELKVAAKLGALADDDKARKVTAVENPATQSDAAAPQPSTTPRAPQPIVAENIRHDWYATGDKVMVDIIAKNVPSDAVQVEFGNESLSVSISTTNATSYNLKLDPLFAPIVPSESSYQVGRSKVEVKLKKAQSGLVWTGLERKHARVEPTTSAPAYPTSARSGPKDWDRMADTLISHKGTAGDDGIDDGGDPANAFFRQLYQKSDPDTRRAMMKSFQESNGTALSTNWAEVSKGRVGTVPPDNMVAKEWES